MFLHIVLFKFEDGITRDHSLVVEAINRMSSLPEQVSEIHSWTHGFNICDRQIAYDYGLIAAFNKTADIEHYLNHPAHQTVTSLWARFSKWNVCDIAI